ncbi:hypothetical protein ACFW04_000803 [Cataglyphis niger]
MGFVMVRKEDGLTRFCVDYRKLIAFSTLDLKSGYWQIKIRQEDKEKTAFSIGNSFWQFTVMPFGLCNAPATFERLMEKVLKELLFNICLVYLIDDVIIFGESIEDMLSRLKQVFSRLRSVNLKLNSKKCSFFKWEIKYLGHVVSQSDHISLRWLMSFKNLNDQMARWLERIQQYNFKVIHRRGKFHGNADGLSRREETNRNYCNKIDTREKELVGRMIFRENNCEGWKKIIPQKIVPQKRVKEILEEAHDSPLNGHFGVNKVLEKIQKEFYWATCKQDICIAKKGPSDKRRSEMQIYNTGVLFKRVQIL